MRILIISNIPTPYRCAFFSELNSKLEENGSELLVIFSAKNEKNRDWNPDSFAYNFKYIILKSKTINIFDTYLHVNINFLKIIKSFRPSHTIIAGSWNLPIVMYLTIFYKKLLNIKLFWNESHMYSVRNTSKPIEFLRKYFYNKFDYFLVPNKLSLAFVMKYNKNARSFILPNTVDQGIFNLNNKLFENIIYDKLFLDNKITIVQVSQLEKRKGVIELVDNFLKLPINIQEKFNLIIIGNGSLKSLILDKIVGKKNIYLFSYISQRDLANLYIKIDFFILSSFKDPNPLSPIEAVFSGKIIFVSKFLGNAVDLIPNIYRNKLIYNPEDDFSFIFYYMIELMNNKINYFEVKETLYKNVFNNWDSNKVCANLINDLKLIHE